MRREVARAQRAELVRAAARSWTDAGLIDGAAAAAISAVYPDDRVRVGRAARVLLFLFTTLAVLALFGFLMLVFGPIFTGAAAAHGLLVGLASAFGIGLVALTELATGPLRRAQTGVEEAAAFLAVGFLIFAAESILSGQYGIFEHQLTLFRIAAVLCALAAWRWGGWVFGAASTVIFFWSLVGLPAVRWLWIVGAAVLFLPLLRAAESGRLAPRQRRAAAAALGVALVAGYAALHPSGTVDAMFETVAPAALDSFEDPSVPSAGAPAVPDAVARGGIVLVPLALLAAGVRSRRRLLLDLGLILTVLSAIWFGRDAGWSPQWLLILGGGGIAIALALAIRRYLDAGPGHERYGFTAEALAGESTAPGTLDVAAALLTLAPAARPAPPPLPEIEGQGGEFGGGGSSSTF